MQALDNTTQNWQAGNFMKMAENCLNFPLTLSQFTAKQNKMYWLMLKKGVFLIELKSKQKEAIEINTSRLMQLKANFF